LSSMARVLVPEDLHRNGNRARDAAVASLVRGVIAIGLGALDKSVRPSEFARKWDDARVPLVLRAAVSPATMAGTPAPATVAAAFLETLVPLSAGADLLGRGIGLNFAGAASIKMPGITVPVADFVGEMQPIPVVTAPTSAGSTLEPHKLAVICVLTRETME